MSVQRGSQRGRHKEGEGEVPVVVGTSYVGFSDIQFSSTCHFRRTHFILVLFEMLHLIKENITKLFYFVMIQAFCNDSAQPFLTESIPSPISNALVMCHLEIVIKLCINFLWDKLK